jgi:hypothetical protein
MYRKADLLGGFSINFQIGAIYVYLVWISLHQGEELLGDHVFQTSGRLILTLHHGTHCIGQRTKPTKSGHR